MSCKPLPMTLQPPLVACRLHLHPPGCAPWPDGVGSCKVPGCDGPAREVR